KIILNDAQGSVFIEDPSGNTWTMDGQGNINVNAPKNFTVNAGEDVNITARKNVSISAGKNMTNSAINDITQSAGNNIKQTATGEILETSNERKEISENEIYRNSKSSNTLAEKIDVFSEKESMTLKSGKTIQNNSAEKTNLF
ncbi:Vgr family protein, partial [Flavobacterium oreochromis]